MHVRKDANGYLQSFDLGTVDGNFYLKAKKALITDLRGNYIILQNYDFTYSFTCVVLQYSPQTTLANGSESPEASEPMRERAWYM